MTGLAVRLAGTACMILDHSSTNDERDTTIRRNVDMSSRICAEALTKAPVGGFPLLPGSVYQGARQEPLGVVAG